MMDEDEAFSKLGLEPNADRAVAAAAYRRLASLYHPDVLESFDEGAKESARRQMSDLNNAYELIKRALAQPNGDNKGEAEKTVAPRQARPAPSRNGVPAKGNRVTFHCPKCDARIRVPLSMRGKEGNCSVCDADLVVPTHRIIRCPDCKKKNKVPNVLGPKKAVCYNCFSEIGPSVR